MRSYKTFCWTVKLSELCEGSLVMKSNFRNCLTVYIERILVPHFVDAFCFSHCMPEHGKFNLIQWNPAITNVVVLKKMFVIAGSSL